MVLKRSFDKDCGRRKKFGSAAGERRWLLGWVACWARLLIARCVSDLPHSSETIRKVNHDDRQRFAGTCNLCFMFDEVLKVLAFGKRSEVSPGPELLHISHTISLHLPSGARSEFSGT